MNSIKRPAEYPSHVGYSNHIEPVVFLKLGSEEGNVKALFSVGLSTTIIKLSCSFILQLGRSKQYIVTSKIYIDPCEKRDMSEQDERLV